MIYLIVTAVCLYVSLAITIISYLCRMRRMDDIDRKLWVTYQNLGAVALEQIIALVAIIAFYATKLNDIQIDVPEWSAVVSAVLMGIGFLLTGYFWFVYRRKHFPEYVKKGEIENKAIRLNDIITVGVATSAMNFAFNIMLSGAFAYIK